MTSRMPAALREILVADAEVTEYVASRVHYNHIPEYSARPHVWFRVSNDNEQLTLDGTGGLHDVLLDLECVDDSETDVQELASHVKTCLHGQKKTMDGVTFQLLSVEDKDDDYVPFSVSGDDGARVVAYTIRAWYST